jgi:cytochrome P450
VKLPSVARGALNSIPGVSLGPPEGELASASPTESVRFTLQAMVPNVAQGLFRRRRRAVGAATRVDVDDRAIGVIDGLRRNHGHGPIWVRVGTDRMLLVLATADVRRVLEGSPRPHAADPEAKRKGMSHFQPDALTISRGEEWRSRREFTEAVLDTDRPEHRHSERFAVICRDETDRLLEEVERNDAGELVWEAFNGAFWRITRRLVLGDGARDDDELTDLLWSLMEEANGLPDEPSEHLEPYLERIERYVDVGDRTGLVGLFGDAPAGDGVKPARQVTHWLFALGDTAAINAFRTLAVLCSFPRERERALDDAAHMTACIQETMRLWPTTPVLSRETVAETEWNGVWVPKGTQILISNTFNHRDAERHEFADRFVPEEWLEGGSAAEDWSYNHFSHGPQGCPGAGIALYVCRSVLTELLDRRDAELVEAPFDPDRPLPRMLDFFPLRFALRKRG